MGELAYDVGSGMGLRFVLLPSVRPLGLEKPEGDALLESRGQGRSLLLPESLEWYRIEMAMAAVWWYHLAHGNQGGRPDNWLIDFVGAFGLALSFQA
jgi:hypothetical protein